MCAKALNDYLNKSREDNKPLLKSDFEKLKSFQQEIDLLGNEIEEEIRILKENKTNHGVKSFTPGFNAPEQRPKNSKGKEKAVRPSL